MEEYPQLSDNIAARRVEIGMSDTGLAARAYVAQATVKRWEAGQTVPSAVHLGRIADALGVSTDDLLGRSVPAGS